MVRQRTSGSTGFGRNRLLKPAARALSLECSRPYAVVATTGTARAASSARPRISRTSQLVSELGIVGFAPDLSVPITEYNRPRLGALHIGTTPVIFEAAFRYTR